MSTARDTDVDQLRDAAHDAFKAFWRGVDTSEAEGLWSRYCVAQQAYEASLRATQDNDMPIATVFAEQLNSV